MKGRKGPSARDDREARPAWTVERLAQFFDKESASWRTVANTRTGRVAEIDRDAADKLARIAAVLRDPAAAPVLYAVEAVAELRGRARDYAGEGSEFLSYVSKDEHEWYGYLAIGMTLGIAAIVDSGKLAVVDV